MQSNPRIIRGFTILELIVALGVTVLMLFMISALFTVTSDGVSLGVAVSDVIGAGRAVGDQLERDAAAMVKPTPTGAGGGFMVIVCQRVQLPYMERRVVNDQGPPDKRRWVRMDQILWVRSANATGSANPEIVAMAPARVSQYAPPTAQETKSADYGLVWYGHGIKTPPDGTAPTAYGQAGPNKIANNLALARQHLLLCNDNQAVVAAAINRVNSAVWNGPVVGMTHPGGANMRFQGTTDVANVPYIFNEATPHPNGGIIGNAAAVGAPATTLLTDLADATYKQRALAYMFFSQGGAPSDRRLWVNPNPFMDPANPYPAGLIAQRHGLFMDNVSDFIVEFAADAADDTSIPPDASIFGDGTPDTYPVGSGINSGETIWYGLANNEKSNSQGPPAWVHTDPVVNIPAPNLVIDANTVAYVFRHDFPQRWPYMVRIRFRIHDQRGELLGDVSPENEISGTPTGTNVGKWFEQIIKVNRD